MEKMECEKQRKTKTHILERRALIIGLGECLENAASVFGLNPNVSHI